MVQQNLLKIAKIQKVAKPQEKSTKNKNYNNLTKRLDILILSDILTYVNVLQKRRGVTNEQFY